MSPGEVALILFGVFAVLIIVRVPVAFALGLACIPVFFIEDRLTPFLLLNEMFKSYNSFLLLAIPFFMLAANLMNVAGITDKLINLSRAIVGHLPGGLGHVSVLVSMLFAGISGSSTAEAAGVGGVLIPAMKKQGYDTEFTVALIACAAVMGVIIPPSILMVVWGGVISVSIGGLFLAGVLPGVLMGISLMIAVYIYAKKRGYPVYPRTTVKEFLSDSGRAVLPILTPGIIVGGIVGGFFTPTEASVVAVLYAMLLGLFVYRTVPFKVLRHTLYDSARFAAIALFCIGTASAFGWLLAYFHIPQLVVDAISGWGGGITSVGFITAAAFLFIGCFIDAIPAIIIVGTILAPLAHKVGMHPIHFAIIGVISIAYGLVTPPYGLCLMIACSIGGIKIKQAVRDTAILFVPMLLVLVVVILFPDLMLWLPRTMMPAYVK
ncbi:MAG TPA: TRAP transporter large permease [Burkholderiales bacterium]|nr:TRAP transporter large permease [Burkholderiales bacterium]